MLQVIIRDLTIPALVGILSAEHTTPQDIRINVTATLSHNTRQDMALDIDQTLDYSLIVNQAKQMAETHTPLVESFAHRLALYCMANEYVTTATVQVEKTHIIPEAAGVGAIITLSA